MMINIDENRLLKLRRNMKHLKNNLGRPNKQEHEKQQYPFVMYLSKTEAQEFRTYLERTQQSASHVLRELWKGEKSWLQNTSKR